MTRSPMTRRWLVLVAGLTMSACVGPPVIRYTLDGSAQTGSTSPLSTSATVIAIARVTVPDYLDGQDILVRHGNVLDPSHTGRWATRLSLGVTELVTERLARTRPDALVTNQPQSTAPTYRLLIDISKFDLATNGTSPSGTATVEADWQIVPRNAVIPVRRARARIALSGPMRADADVVALTTAALIRLTASIDITSLR